MNRASVGPWTPSFGTTRKKVGLSPFVSVTRVAEPEMKPRPAFLRIGPAATTAELEIRPGDAEDARIGGELLGDGRGLRRVDLDVALDELE